MKNINALNDIELLQTKVHFELAQQFLNFSLRLQYQS